MLCRPVSAGRKVINSSPDSITERSASHQFFSSIPRAVPSSKRFSRLFDGHRPCPLLSHRRRRGSRPHKTPFERPKVAPGEIQPGGASRNTSGTIKPADASSRVRRQIALMATSARHAGWPRPASAKQCVKIGVPCVQHWPRCCGHRGRSAQLARK